MARIPSCLVLASVSLLAGPTGCLAPFETRPAYDDQRYLCDDDSRDEVEAIVEDCRASRDANDADDQCAGVWSMRGELQGEDITIESTFTSSSFHLIDLGMDERRLDRIDANGPTPYFSLSVQFDSIGGDIFDSPRTLEFDTKANVPLDHLDDQLVGLALRLSGGGDSANLGGETGQGSVTIEAQTLDEMEGSFEGAFGPDEEHIDGCFHLLALETRIKEQ